jgi:hypothetical protein
MNLDNLTNLINFSLDLFFKICLFVIINSKIKQGIIEKLLLFSQAISGLASGANHK